MGTLSSPRPGQPTGANHSAGATNTRNRNELKRLGTEAVFPVKAILPHEAHDLGIISFAEYAHAAINSQLRSDSEKENAIVTPNTFAEDIRLPEAKQWKGPPTKNRTASSSSVYTYSLSCRNSPGVKVIGANGGFSRSKLTARSKPG